MRSHWHTWTATVRTRPCRRWSPASRSLRSATRKAASSYSLLEASAIRRAMRKICSVILCVSVTAVTVCFYSFYYSPSRTINLATQIKPNDDDDGGLNHPYSAYKSAQTAHKQHHHHSGGIIKRCGICVQRCNLSLGNGTKQKKAHLAHLPCKC